MSSSVFYPAFGLGSWSDFDSLFSLNGILFSSFSSIIFKLFTSEFLSFILPGDETSLLFNLSEDYYLDP